jgi:hypothetical protein
MSVARLDQLCLAISRLVSWYSSQLALSNALADPQPG